MLHISYLENIQRNGPLIRDQKGMHPSDGKVSQEFMMDRVRNVMSVGWLQKLSMLVKNYNNKRFNIMEIDFLLKAKNSTTLL